MQRSYLRLMSAALMLISAVLLGYGFFKWSWMQGREGTRPLTPYQIWIGKDDNGKAFTFNMPAYDRLAYKRHGSVGGFDDVRGVDRLLIFILGAALVLGQVAMLIAGRRTRPALPTAILAVVIALALMVFPFLWQSLSSSNWEHYYENDRRPGPVDASVRPLINRYDTGEFVLAAWIGLIGALLAAGMELFLQRAPNPLSEVAQEGISE